MSDQLAHRLRELRDRNHWTVAAMAQRTGIPKRTLDKYMLRNGASLPGLEALRALSHGLGVSLDWLVFGSEGTSKTVGLIVNRACGQAVRRMAELIIQENDAGYPKLIAGEQIFNLTPEAWSLSLGEFAQAEAEKQAAQGVTLGELVTWREAQNDRSSELFLDMVEELIPDLSEAERKTLKM